MQRDNHVGVEAEAKTPVAPSILDLHTLSIPNSENLINGCRPMLTNMPTVTRSEQGNNRSRVGERLKPCFFERGNDMEHHVSHIAPYPFRIIYGGY